MASTTLDYGYDADVSRTLQPGNRSFDTLLWQQGRPILDSDQNLLFDILSEKSKTFIESQMQSGFLDPVTYSFNSSWVDQFGMNVSKVFVNGWQLLVNPNGIGRIILSPAYIGSGAHRWDFIFLEVFKVIVTGNSTDHKPSSTELYKDGNVQDMTTTLPDDIIDTVVGLETSKRVQIQYRIRIQEDVAAPNQQNANIFDSSTFAQGGATIPIDPYVFVNQGSVSGDYGLWKAGNGDNASRAQLQTVDGFVYAIPLAFAFRRAQAPYIDEDIDGQQASNAQISSGISDRIDGLFYDSVAQTDIVDLRHKSLIGNNFDYAEILESSIQNLLTGNNTIRRPVAIKYEAISDVSITGYSILNSSVCDKVRSVWSDIESTIVSNTVRLNIGDTDTSQDFYTSRASGSWQIGDTITINIPDGAPVGTIILGTDDSNSTTKPFVFRNAGGLLDVAGSWSNTDTDSALFTFDENLSNEEIWIVYDVQYPENQGLSYIPETYLKLDYTNVAAYPTVQNSYISHTGTVRVGSNLLNKSLTVSRDTKELNFQHVSMYNNYGANYTVNKRNKEINITPLVTSTTAVGNDVRTLMTENFDTITRRIFLPFQTPKLWFVRGVYTDQSGGNEVATEVSYAESPSLVSGEIFQHPSPNYSFANIFSMIFDPGGANVQLIVNSGGDYWPVYRQDSSGNVNQFILVDSNGDIYTPPSPNPLDYQINHRSIPTAKVFAYTGESANPKDNWIQVRNDATLVDGQELWIDIDYIGEPHDGGQIKMAYKYQPYQGMIDTSGTRLSAKIKAFSAFTHTDGTSNITENIDPKTYIQPLISYLPTPDNMEYLLKGDPVEGIETLGEYNGTLVCYVKSKVLDYSTTAQYILKLNDIISGEYNAGLNTVERGGNDATDLKSAMIAPISSSNYKQAVIFGLAATKDNFDLQNELVLYVWTYTNNDDESKFTSANVTNIGVDFYQINNRPLIRYE